MASIKPENALRRADELLSVGEQSQALQVLHDVITNRRNRIWSETFQNILIRYLSLCVKMRKGKMAKDGLHQFKLMCHQTHLPSLDVVVRHFLKEAAEHAKLAQSKAEQLIIDIEDLDAEESAESLMLASVSGEDSKERTDREVVTPWLKFLWETYRIVLDTLRNNSKLEHLYQGTAQQAFDFCMRFKRKTEFRRLCEILRNHLQSLQKYQSQAGAVNITIPETLQGYMQTRFSQLDVAVSLDLWQDAFRSIEDIHGLINRAKQPPPSHMMALYYEKLANIFWVSENYLYHAHALLKYYRIYRQNKSIQPDDLKRIASSVLLASISVPHQSSGGSVYEFDIQSEKNMRMASLLGFSVSPKRETLLSELREKGISTQVFPQLSDLLNIVEDKFQPLKLCASLKDKLEFIESQPALKQYLRPIEKLIFVRLLLQLSKVYQAMKLGELHKLVFFMDACTIEQSLVECIQNKTVEMRVDHRNQSLVFGSDSLECDSVKNQLTLLSENLQRAVQMIHPEFVDEENARKAAFFNRVVANMEAEQRRNLARKAIIEKRKERMEAMEKVKQQREEEERAAQAEKAKEEVANALSAEPEKSEEAKIREKIDKEKAERQAKLDEAMEKHKKEKEKMERRLAKTMKDLDHLERAIREEERPLLEKRMEEMNVDDTQYVERQFQEFLQQHKRAHQHQLQEKTRLLRMKQDVEEFEAAFEQQRSADFERRKQRHEQTIAEVLATIDRLRDEKMERARQRFRELKRARQMEEEERAARAEAEARRRAEEEERLRKLDEIEERKRQKELEAMDRNQRDVESARGAAAGVAPARQAAGWREREAARRGERPGPERQPERQPERGAGGWRDRQAPPAESGERGGGGWRDRQAPPAEERGSGGWRDRQAPPEGAPERGAGGWRDRQPAERGDRQPTEERGAGGWRDRQPAERGGDRQPAERGGGGGWRDRQAPQESAPERGGSGGGWRDRQNQDGERGGSGGGWRDRQSQDGERGDRAVPAQEGVTAEKAGWREREQRPGREGGQPDAGSWKAQRTQQEERGGGARPQQEGGAEQADDGFTVVSKKRGARK